MVFVTNSLENVFTYFVSVKIFVTFYLKLKYVVSLVPILCENVIRCFFSINKSGNIMEYVLQIYMYIM